MLNALRARSGRLRSGTTLIELSVALTVGGFVIATAVTLGARSQRFHRELAVARDRMDQVDQTASLLAVELRALAPGEGDITAGQALDTAMQFRSTIASSVVCDTTGGRLTLAPASAPAPVLTSYLTFPAAGDTVWALQEVGDTVRWFGRPIISVASESGQCALGGVFVHGAAPPLPRVVLSLAPDTIGMSPPGAPIRITRLVRYSLYRASDGAWYLGGREWNASAGRFNTIQPVSGPFLSAAKGGLTFRYRDSIGASVTSGSTDTRGIALVEITLQSDSGAPTRSSSFGSGSTRVVFSVAVRNRAR